jgi:hypothetical protein
MTYIAGMNQFKDDPEKQDQWSRAYTQQLKDNGYISADQQSQLNNMPVDQRIMSQSLGLNMNGAVEYFKSLNKPTTNGQNLKLYPDGTVEYTATPTSATQTQLQENLGNQMQLRDKLQNISGKYDSEYLTGKGRLEGLVGNAESYLGIKNTTTDYAEKEAGLKAQLKDATLAAAKTFNGRISGPLLDQVKGMIPDFDKDSPAAFKGKMQAYQNVLNAGIQIQQELIKNGIPEGSPQFKSELSSRLGSFMNTPQPENSPTSASTTETNKVQWKIVNGELVQQ